MTREATVKFYILFLPLMSVACGGVGASIDDSNVDAASTPNARVQAVPDAAVPDAPIPESDAGEDAGNGDSGTCSAEAVSLPPGAVCGPQGPGMVCGTSGTVYVCHGAYRPAIEGCVLYSTHIDANGYTYTRSLCPSDAWTQVDDPTGLCTLNFPLRFYAPLTGGTSPVPPVAGGCIAGPSMTWNIDGAHGRVYCCSAP